MTEARDLDVVLFGATGFVGRLTAGYLARHAPEQARIGLAGRSKERLEKVRAELGPAAAGWPVVVADSSDTASVAAMAQQAAVVATTVGPYARYGRPVVEACAAAGTHYADLTGEALFVRECIDRYGTVAEGSGARIVHSCGFDSVPSDLGVLMLHEAARADGAGDLEDTTLVVTAMRGGLSGGTLASGIGQMEEMRRDPGRRRLVEDPYTLSPDRSAEPDLGDQGELRAFRHDGELGGWVAPFMMAGYNTRVVRLSNALQGWAYGRRFRYQEVMGAGGGPLGAVKAAAISGAMLSSTAVLGFGPAKPLLERVLPSPGEGPSEKTQRTGLFRMEIHTRTSTGARYVATVAAKGDPGYAATSVMLGESALSLAYDGARLPARAGVLTPATGIGMPLVERLRAAGFTCTVERR